MLAHEVGSAGRVVAVEALPHNAAAARQNRDRNGGACVEVVDAGVAAADGTLRLSRALNAQTAAASDYAGTFEVAAVCVDTLAERYGRPDVLFVDVEGMEVEVLRGATHTLATRPDVFVEVHAGCGLEAAGGTVDGVLAFVPPERYELSVHTEVDPNPTPLADVPGAVLRDRFFLTAVGRPT